MCTWQQHACVCAPDCVAVWVCAFHICSPAYLSNTQPLNCIHYVRCVSCIFLKKRKVFLCVCWSHSALICWTHRTLWLQYFFLHVKEPPRLITTLSGCGPWPGCLHHQRGSRTSGRGIVGIQACACAATDCSQPPGKKRHWEAAMIRALGTGNLAPA